MSKNNLSLRFDTSGNPYNATAGSAEPFQSIGEAMVRSALSRSAIAPMWEVHNNYLKETACGNNFIMSKEAA